MATTQQSLFEKMQQDSLLDGNSAIYLESIYESYLEDPASVSTSWRSYFDDLPAQESLNGGIEPSHAKTRDQFRNLGFRAQAAAPQSQDAEHREKQVKVLQLINAYRFNGHVKASTNPLAQGVKKDVPELTLAFHSLSSADLDTVFNSGSMAELGDATLREIICLLYTSPSPRD